ncbi:hypothetical protein AB2L27_04855 [Kineococcus sp. LSe6-4]|uniref:HPP family protein n=1 Tax=Kineococcus halophytocola TaxID=3234027 RepID=A0ABV4GXS0_9ACTN
MRRSPGGDGPGTRRTGFALLFGQAGAGLVVGVLWWALTRRPATALVGEPVVTSAAVYPMARDGVFSVLTGLVGLAAAVVVLRRARQAPVTVFVAALAGALTSSLLAAGTGSALPPTGPAEAAHVTLTAWVAVLVQPFVVSAAVALVTLGDVLARWVRTP